MVDMTIADDSSDSEQKSMLNRLSRIEGQVRGIKRMLEADSDCPDILMQVSAVNAALNSFARVLLSEYLRSGIPDDSIDELLTVLRKLMK